MEDVVGDSEAAAEESTPSAPGLWLALCLTLPLLYLSVPMAGVYAAQLGASDVQEDVAWLALGFSPLGFFLWMSTLLAALMARFGWVQRGGASGWGLSTGALQALFLVVFAVNPTAQSTVPGATAIVWVVLFSGLVCLLPMTLAWWDTGHPRASPSRHPRLSKTAARSAALMALPLPFAILDANTSVPQAVLLIWWAVAMLVGMFGLRSRRWVEAALGLALSGICTVPLLNL